MNILNGINRKLTTGLLLCMVGTSAQAVLISSFDPAVVYDANTTIMDANIGISGHTIEDFEDGSYVSGLTVTATDPVTAISGTFPNAVWDGSNVLLTNPNANGFGPVSFEIAAGATSFGIWYW